MAKINLLISSCSRKMIDSEENHLFVREKLNRFSIIPPRYENVSIWKNKRQI